MSALYLGRIVAVGKTPSGKIVVAYRVSSRSFPNREAKIIGQKAAIVPRAGYENDIQKNPYISYHCAIIVGDTAILSNGSQTDPIAEKIASGTPIRDAIATGLLTLDYEKDAYDTPRIVAAAKIGDVGGWLGIVRKNGIEVREIPLVAGKVFYLSTYERNLVREENAADIPELTAKSACDFVLRDGDFANFSNPVSVVAAVENSGKFDLAAV